MLENYQKEEKCNDVDYIYHNVILTNNQPFDILAKVKETRYAAIVEKPNDWEFSIVRFSVSSNEVPIFHPIIPNPALPLQSNMSITLGFGGSFFQQFIQTTPLEAKDGVFDFQIWLDHLNDAALLAFTALKAAFPGAAPTIQPFFFLNPTTLLISMYTQDSYLESNPLSIQIFMNQQLQNIIDLPFSSYNNVPAPFGTDFQIAVRDWATTLPVPPRTGFPLALSALAGNWIQSSQSFPSLDEWSDVQRVFFTTGLIPVNGELLPNTVGQDQDGNIATTSQQIVTDFLVNTEQSEPTRHAYTYVPSAEYRIVSLMGTKPIRTIDVNCFYSTYDGREFPLKLAPRTNMSLKMMFRRKK